MKLENPDIRYLYDLKKVVYDKEWFNKSPNLELYYMYRGVETKGDLRYDITVMPAKMLGVEFVKTLGHYHPENYGELYIILKGRAIYLMQKIDKNGEIEDIYAVEAKKDDYIVIPPQYGHITINPGDEDLKMANWVYNDFKSVYDPILKKGGGGYFYINQGWIKNENYTNIPDLRMEKAQDSMPDNLSFLR